MSSLEKTIYRLSPPQDIWDVGIIDIFNKKNDGLVTLDKQKKTNVCKGEES